MIFNSIINIINDQKFKLLQKPKNTLFHRQMQAKHLQLYLYFKEQLLTAMIDKDPLSILESKIFQNYEQELAELYKNNEVRKIMGQIKMESKIRRYWIDGVQGGVDVVERRSHSCDLMANGATNKGEMVWRNRVRMIEEQGKIDLAVWSNIMHNHFRNRHDNEVDLTKNAIEIHNRQVCQQEKENCMRNANKNQNICQNMSLMESCLLSSTQTQTLLSKLTSKMVKNPTAQNITHQLHILFAHLQQQNQKIIIQLNRLRKENDRLARVVQEASTKELQYIVQFKHIEKKISQKEEELRVLFLRLREKEQIIRDRQSQLGMVIRQKVREIESLQEENIRKNYIEELKQKLAIDSIRRATLCSLSKERFEIELKKQQLGLKLGPSTSSRSEQNEGDTQQTRCDYQ